MDASSPALLRRQFDIAWALTEMALDGLADDECHWLPSPDAWRVRRGSDGVWRADWAEVEPDPPPLTTIGWLTWHVDMWWSVAHDQAVGAGELRPEQVVWAGSAAAASARLRRLHDDWSLVLDGAAERDLAAARHASWPFQDGRPFGDVVAWVNLELIKNAAEIGLWRRVAARAANRGG